MRILIAGGTGKLGRALTARLADGHQITIIARDTAADVHDGVTAIAGDITQPADVDSIVSQAGEVDVLINAAGGWVGGPLTETDPDEIRKLIDLNLTGTILLTRAVLKQMQDRHSGIIVNVSSDSALGPDKGSVVYAATKAGVQSFSDSLRHAVAADGIKVSAVYPGAFNAEAEGDIMAADQVAQAIEFILTRDPDVVVPHLEISHREWKV